MNTKQITVAVAIGAAAVVAFYFIRRNKGKMDVQGLKNSVKRATHHLTDVFHNAKEAAQHKMAGA
jgi:hypothetical protein